MQTRSLTSLPFLTTSVDHPRLSKTDSKIVRRCFREYDQYSSKVQERAAQLIVSGVLSTETVRSLSSSFFCVDVEYLEALYLLELIPDTPVDYDDLTDEVRRAFLETKAQESKETI